MHQVGTHGDVDFFHGEGAFRAIDSSKAAEAGQRGKEEPRYVSPGRYATPPPFGTAWTAMPPGVARAIRAAWRLRGERTMAPFSTFPKRGRFGSVEIVMKKEAPLE